MASFHWRCRARPAGHLTQNFPKSQMPAVGIDWYVSTVVLHRLSVWQVCQVVGCGGLAMVTTVSGDRGFYPYCLHTHLGPLLLVDEFTWIETFLTFGDISLPRVINITFSCSLARNITSHSKENLAMAQLTQMNDDYTSNSHYLTYIILFNPFTPKSDQCQICSAASPGILHRTVWGIWLFIAYSDERWLYYQFSLPHQYISL